MNILIVGNGFDLSHYLPTKYDHFMVAMDAIENWDESKGDMGFDDLFGSLYEKEDYFFGYTKAMYNTDEIKISVDQIKELKERLKENIWYQYFSDHVREVKTWIDFETKILEALDTLDIFFTKYQSIKENSGSVYNQISGIFSPSNRDEYLNFLERERLILKALAIVQIKNENDESLYIDYEIKNDFLDIYKNDVTLDYQKILSFLMKNLSNLKVIFSNYLFHIVDEMKMDFTLKHIFQIDLMFTFNYTATLENKYKQAKNNIRHIHGETIKGNIVLGVSDLGQHFLDKYNSYGFTKYHQKLLLDTDYQFILEEESIQNQLNFWLSPEMPRSKKIYSSERGTQMQTNIFIWGHSLDVSDEIYIQEIFSLNDERDCNVRLVVYFFNDQAKFDLLANLLRILKKEKVENWMKKGWLKFEKNPDIAEINGIKPVDLPKV